ncbi:uncharacterized protein LOC122369204 isoform X1 [Amphibalanus amphitrite]|uniref:uncharacterized protein LOC122369204 isoform X1 n=2 Tax=Amphibalanus amphitrite TaxID=1232801 RepID=UPI001C9244B7|nr:uncharacterized protein LOC122369204 isoform X1 [Amphibalanus amphitrite]
MIERIITNEIHFLRLMILSLVLLILYAWLGEFTIGSECFCTYWFQMNVKLSCSLCHHTDTDLREFCLHLRRHGSDPYFHVDCPMCRKKFTTVRYWKDHVLSRKCSPVEAAGCASNAPETSSSQNQQETGVEIDSDSGDKVEDDPGAHDVRKQLLGLIIKLRAQNVTENSCHAVLEFIEDFSKEVIQECLSLCGEAPCCHLEEYYHKLKTLNELSKLQGSDHLERTAVKEFETVDPVSVTLGTDEHGKDETLQYLPVTPQLKQLCEQVNACEDATASPDGILGGLQDGYVHNNNNSEGRLLLSVYYDSFQVGNPLGSRAKNQKVGVVYFSVNSLKNSALRNKIILSVVFREALLATHSWATLLDPLITELKELESSGFVANIRGGSHFTAHVAVLIGDNLGVHSVAGFSQCFSGGAMICRHCHGTADEIRTKTKLEEFDLRSKEDYDSKVKLLLEEGFGESLSKAYGIRSTCPFSSLTGFHPMTSIPPDVMHDLLEGVVPSTIALVCGGLSSRGDLSLNDVNRAIRSFPYSQVDTNHPAPLRRDGKGITVKQQASEAWCLLRLLPLILLSAGVLSSAVSGSKMYSLLVQLIKIMLLLTVFTVSLQDLDILQGMVEKFLTDLLACFPEFKLTPKHHFLLHYADQTRRHGPLRYLWSMRYEAKHQTLKRSVANSRNRKNICKSIATRYQLKSVADAMELRGRMSGGQAFRGEVPEAAAALTRGAQLFKKALINGEKYCAGEALLLHTGVAVIICICKHPSSVESDKQFLVQHQVAIYDTSLGAFIISGTDQYDVFDCASLVDPQPLGTYWINDHHYAVPRRLIPGYGML